MASGNFDPQPAISQYLNPNSANISRTHNEQSITDNYSQLQSRFRQSGYIVGPPVAYTQEPILPANFHPFSPERTRNLPIVYSQPRSRQVSPGRPIVNQITSNSPTHYNTSSFPIQQHVSSIPISNGQINSNTVPYSQYDRLVTESKNWETRYNELHLKYLNSVSMSGQGGSQDLKNENQRLRQRVRQLEGRQKSFYDRLDRQFTDLVHKYRQSTMKQCMLLMDRYKLQCKHAEREK